MAGEVVERQSAGARRSLRSKRSLAVRIDMTPMVDIAFLLLIFYMVSTVFSQPQAMEINLPGSDKSEIRVKPENLLTLWVDEDNAVYWKIGKAHGGALPELIPRDPGAVNSLDSLDSLDSVEYVIASDALIAVLCEEHRANPALNTLVLIHPQARFSAMVEILDDISLTERLWNLELARLLGKKLDGLSKEDGRFSYRYAIGEWDERFERMLDRARAQAGD